MRRCLLLLLLLAASQASAQVYRWVDAHGRVNYSNAAPPAGLQATTLQRGMSEGELLVIAGEPDLRRRERAVRTYTYLPTPGDPCITTITLVRGRISEIERVRKF